MVINPTVLKWRAPTKNVDGTSIDYEMAYELEVNTVLTATFPGRLNPDGLYEQSTDTMFPEYGEYVVRLRAFRIDMPEVKSDWSNAVTYFFDKRVPEAPLLVE